MYSIRQLEAFYWSAKLGSFTASARKLHTSQSAISKRVGELEAYFGCPLFARRVRKLSLTHPGKKLLRLSREALDLHAKLKIEMLHPNGLEGSFRFGVTEMIALTWLPRLIEYATRTYPKIDVDAEVDMGAALYNKLSKDEIDLAVMLGPFWTADYESVPLYKSKCQWVASPDLRLPKVVTPEILSRYPLICEPSSSSFLPRLYENWLTQKGYSFQRQITCSSVSVIAQLTVSGIGVAYLSERFCQPLITQGKLCALRTRDPHPAVEFFAVSKKNNSNPFKALFVDAMKKFCDS